MFSSKCADSTAANRSEVTTPSGVLLNSDERKVECVRWCGWWCFLRCWSWYSSDQSASSTASAPPCLPAAAATSRRVTGGPTEARRRRRRPPFSPPSFAEFPFVVPAGRAWSAAAPVVGGVDARERCERAGMSLSLINSSPRYVRGSPLTRTFRHSYPTLHCKRRSSAPREVPWRPPAVRKKLNRRKRCASQPHGQESELTLLHRLSVN